MYQIVLLTTLPAAASAEGSTEISCAAVIALMRGNPSFAAVLGLKTPDWATEHCFVAASAERSAGTGLCSPTELNQVMRETFKTADAELLKWLTGAHTGPAGQPVFGALGPVAAVQ